MPRLVEPTVFQQCQEKRGSRATCRAVWVCMFVSDNGFQKLGSSHLNR